MSAPRQLDDLLTAVLRLPDSEARVRFLVDLSTREWRSLREFRSLFRVLDTPMFIAAIERDPAHRRRKRREAEAWLRRQLEGLG
jgi:hypothetical protein